MIVGCAVLVLAARPRTDAATALQASASASGCGAADTNLHIIQDECPRNYTAAHVLALAERSASKRAQQQQQEAHARASAACASGGRLLLDTGGWCIEHGATVRANRTSVLTRESVDADYEGSANYATVHPSLALFTTLAQFVLPKAGVQPTAHISGSLPLYSLNDLGAGVGNLGHNLRGALPQLDYRGFDGAGNVHNFTRGYVSFRDLTAPAAIPPADWVLSTEVGEHIPHAAEAQFVANLHAANCRGLVLSWAVPGQGGRGHINVHTNAYLIRLLSEMGYVLNEPATRAFRTLDADCVAAATTLSQRLHCAEWLTRSGMVFDRIVPSTAAGCSA